MRNLCAAGAVVLGLALAAAAQDQKIEIKPLPQPGTYVLRLRMVSNQTLQGVSSALTCEMVTEVSIAALDARHVKVRIAPKHVKADISRPDGGSSTVEQKSDDVFFITLDDDGKIVDAVAQSPPHGTRPTTGPRAAQSGDRAATTPALQFDKTEAERLLAMALPHLSCTTDRPVAVGNQWNRKMPGTNEKCKLTGITNGLARVEAAFASSKSDGLNSTMIVQRTTRMSYDIKLGLATSFEIEYETRLQHGGSENSDGKKEAISATLTPGPYKESAATRPASPTQPPQR